jgi:hypothetical protein
MNIHAANQIVFDRVYVFDHTVQEQISRKIAHYLVDSDDDTPGTVGTESNGVDVRIDESPLLRPVLTHTIMPVDCPAFHSVWPFHVDVHGGERTFKVARIECRVSPA